MPEELDLREALDAAVETHSESEQANEAPESVAAPENTEVPEQQNGEAAGAPESATAKPDDKQPAVEKAAAPPTDAEARQHRVDRAPQSWKKEAKGEWNALPLHVRQEVYRREQQIERSLQEAAPARQIAQQFQETVAPYMARINSFGIQPTQAIQQLLQADYTLATAGPRDAARLMAKLVKDYNIDIRELDDALVGTPQADPQQVLAQQIEQSLMQRLSPVLSFAQQQQNYLAQQQQAEQQQAAGEIEQMSLDPRFPYFDDVRQDMADIIELGIKRGIAITPEQAYHRAVSFNPETSNQVKAQTAHQQAQRAKVASSSVTGSPVTGGQMSLQGDGSLRGALEAAFGGQRL